MWPVRLRVHSKELQNVPCRRPRTTQRGREVRITNRPSDAARLTIRPTCTSKIAVTRKAMIQSAKSARELRHSNLAVEKSTSDCSAAKMMAANTAKGSVRKRGVSHSSTSTITPACTTPCIGVPPPSEETNAEREKEPETGKALNNPPKKLAKPSAMSSWLLSIGYPCLTLKIRAIDMETRKPVKAMIAEPERYLPSSATEAGKCGSCGEGRPVGKRPIASIGMSAA
mmetsp:Transcript_12876/g.30229  ORF Transcript_12876/g.30229 Transcript_12876/m.30229 type:complete len:227 (-) Transcript_12876:917-1597(-)